MSVFCPLASGIMSTFKGVCMAVLQKILTRFPLLLAWVVLSIGMVAILLYASKDVGLLPGQLGALVVATVLLAGACVWIISWE